MIPVLLYFTAYLVGSIPFGVLVARAKGVDLLSFGSGNPGATNVARALGPKLGVFVFLLDVVKGTVPAALGGLWFASQSPSIWSLDARDHSLFLGSLAVIGHSLSPFLRFRGGKGIATGLGALLGTAPVVGVAGFSGFIILFLPTRIVSLASLVGATLVLVAGYVTKQSPLFLWVYGVLVAYVFWKHRENIGRLLKGQEKPLRFGANADSSQTEATATKEAP